MRFSLRILLIFCFYGILHSQAQEVEGGNDVRVINFPVTKFMDKYKASYYLFQVSSAVDFKKEHLKGAILLDLTSADLAKQWAKLDKNNNIFVYGLDAESSIPAAEALLKAGFINVMRLDGSLADLKKAGFPLAK